MKKIEHSGNQRRLFLQSHRTGDGHRQSSRARKQDAEESGQP